MKATYFPLLLLVITVTVQASLIVQSLVKPGDLVFDVGAHVGNKTALYLGRHAQVVCIEPQPSCIAILQNKFGKNPNVSIEKIGLAAQPGTLSLAICSAANTISTFSPEWQTKSRFSNRGYRWDTTITATVSTLDTLIKKYGTPQFCKIDVENFELEVLKGLSEPVPALSFEFHVETFDNAKECLDRLEKIGYTKFNFAAGEIQKFSFNEWISKEKLIEQLQLFSVFYRNLINDPLWGDIYAVYP